ncbi:MAG: family 78 glycoside hydrolase catalytic domain [Clostridia bacterium]|nr:family 78 glycoside hydrolase catalytic domain [Clostridia bacterium]
MNQAIWITAPGYVSRRYQNPWGDHGGGYALGRYNCKELPFDAYDGILTLCQTVELPPDRPIKQATFTATALGIYRVFLNGHSIGSDEYKPGWTDYRARVFSDSYDVTLMLQKSNLLVAEVSAGWWAGRISYGFYDFPPCAFCGELVVEFLDGGTEVVATDESWCSTVCGPILRADIWDGEYYDARIPHASLYPEAHSWSRAVPFNGFSGVIEPRIGPQIRVKSHLERHPLMAEIIEGIQPNGNPLGAVKRLDCRWREGCERGVLRCGTSMILDIGQNMVGRPYLRLKAEKDTVIKVFFAETRNDSGDPQKGNDGPEGSLYMSNYRSALSRITYISNGGEVEYEPTHSFFGFRYLEIEADADIEVLEVRCRVVGSEIEETGSFVCDHPDVNQLYSNILWGMRGNYFSVPTDCPQRDERFGWTGDTQVFCGAATYIGDVKDFLRKWLGDLRDSQMGANGAYCDVAPRMFRNDELNFGNAGWGDAGLIVPYRLWLMYGDTEILREHYDSMEAYMRYLEGYGMDGAKDFYGDWLGYEPTDKRLMAMAYYVNDARLMELFSRLLGKKERASDYERLYHKLLQGWQDRFLINGSLTCKTQTACLMALSFGLIPKENQMQVVQDLRENIIANDNTLATGFVGTSMLCRTLSEVGADDLAYNVLLQEKDPGWLYSVRQGATTLWERWNSYTKEKGFGKVEMNSFNHYAYGAIAEWFYSGICGILPTETGAGFSELILRPCPDLRRSDQLPNGQKHINYAKATYRTPHGTVESSWQMKEKSIVYDFVIPNGVRAEIRVICPSEELEINGVRCSAKELNAVRDDGNRLCFRQPAGHYKMKVYSADLR